jgi:hypothetical protein
VRGGSCALLLVTILVLVGAVVVFAAALSAGLEDLVRIFMG